MTGGMSQCSSLGFRIYPQNQHSNFHHAHNRHRSITNCGEGRSYLSEQAEWEGSLNKLANRLTVRQD